MHHVHLTRELWRAVSEGRRDPGDLSLVACGHLFQLCAICKAEFDAFQEEAAEEGLAYTHPVAIERSMKWAEAMAREVALERRQAEPKLAALLALPEAERLAAVEQAPHEYRGPALAQLLIEASRGRLPGAPREALAHAELAAVLLLHTPSSPFVVELYARATAHVANALRVTGQLPEAARHFRAARFLLREQGGGDRSVRAEMDSLEGSLRRAERRFDDAEALVWRAVQTYRAEGNSTQAARNLLTLGVMYQELRDGARAAAAAREALELLDEEEEPRLCFIARHNLADGLCEQGEHEAAARLLAENEPAASRLGDSLSALRIAWVEGKVARGLGQQEAAESSWLAARHGFLRQGIAYDAALVSLELAGLYLETGRTAEVKRLAAEMVEIFARQEVHREATAALMLFEDAANLERLSLHLVRELATYLTRARRDPAYAFQAAS